MLVSKRDLDYRTHHSACWWKHPDCATERLAALQDIHKACWATPLDEGGCSKEEAALKDHEAICIHCGVPWPCMTIQTVQGGLG